MNSSTLDGFAEAAAMLTPAAVSQFLASSDWQLERRWDKLREVWRLTGRDGLDQGRIMLPLATDYDDYPARFKEALLALGRVHDWDAGELYERVMATRADLFFVRLDQAGAEGTIPFQQAEQTLQALHKLLRAVATTTADPTHSHLGRRPTTVTEFLDEDVRLGHTKRGSFVFTIVSRLDGVAGEALAADGRTKPFPRKVMENLATGLMTTQQLIRSWDPAVLESPEQFGLSAGFIESLEDMTQQPSLRSLDLSFAWAAAMPTELPQNAQVVLGRDVIGGLPRVREYLVRREEPPRRETLVGLVKSLSWGDNSPSTDDETASVVLFADVNGKQRNVTLTLSREDHDWAILAYRNKLPMTVTGDLTYERRSWRLIGDVSVDPSFLCHYGSRRGEGTLPDGH